MGDKGGDSTLYHYNSQGLLERKIRYSGNSFPIQFVYYTYDKNNKLIKRVDSTRNRASNEELFYSDKNVIKYVSKNSNYNTSTGLYDIKIDTINFKYNSNGTLKTSVSATDSIIYEDYALEKPRKRTVYNKTGSLFSTEPTYTETLDYNDNNDLTKIEIFDKRYGSYTSREIQYENGKSDLFVSPPREFNIDKINPCLSHENSKYLFSSNSYYTAGRPANLPVRFKVLNPIMKNGKLSSLEYYTEDYKSNTSNKTVYTFYY